MKTTIKYLFIAIGMILSAVYIYYLVTFLSPESSLFAPR